MHPRSPERGLRRGSRRWSSVLACASTLGLGCHAEPAGGPHDGDAASSPADTTSAGDEPTAVISEVVAARCATFFDCSCNDIHPGLYGSPEECTSYEEGQALAIIAIGEDAGLEFDAACVRARYDRLLDLGCGSDWSAASARVECKVYHGSRQLGESCSVYESAEGDDCAPDLRCWSGACVEFKLEYPLGDTCYLNHPYCEGAAVCVDAEEGKMRCTALPQAGDPCLYHRCGEGLACDEAEKCVVAPGVGEACGQALIECDPCLQCGGDEPRVCEPRSTSAPGESCDDDDDCDDAAWCNIDAGSTCSNDPISCWNGGSPPRPTTWESKLCLPV